MRTNKASLLMSVIVSALLTSCSLQDDVTVFLEPLDPRRPIELQYPAGGETFDYGDTVNIVCNVDSKRVTGVVFFLSLDNGISWCTILDSGLVIVPETDRIARCESTWIIGQEYLPERPEYQSATVYTQCKVKVEDYTQSGLPSYSSKTFTINR